MSTLTESRRDITRNIARLRAAGCTVWTIIGHDLGSGRYVYGVRLPKRVDRQAVWRARPEGLRRNAEVDQLDAEVVANHEAHTLIVRALPGRTWSTDSRRTTTANVAEALGWLAGEVEETRTPAGFSSIVTASYDVFGDVETHEQASEIVLARMRADSRLTAVGIQVAEHVGRYGIIRVTFVASVRASEPGQDSALKILNEAVGDTDVEILVFTPTD